MKKIKSILLLSAVFSLGVFAQDSAEVSDSDVEEVITVGSQIKGASITGALPVTVISNEDIDALGITSGDELLESLPEMGQNFFNEQETMSGAINASRGDSGAYNLRSMGVGNTLVLLNGRRMVNGAGYQTELIGGDYVATLSVNSNTIPTAGLDRLEILKDGASAIYGADAVAGVINNVLDTDFVGFEVVAKAYEYKNFGAQNGKVAIKWGKDFNDGATNVSIFADTFLRGRIRAIEDPRWSLSDWRHLAPEGFTSDTSLRRNYSYEYPQFDATGWRDSRITDSAGDIQIHEINDSDCTASGDVFDTGFGTCITDDNGFARLNGNIYRDHTSKLERDNLFIFINHEIANGNEIYAEIGRYDSFSKRYKEPGGLSSSSYFTFANTNYWMNNLLYADGTNVFPTEANGGASSWKTEGWRITPHGRDELSRVVDVNRESYRYVLGSRGALTNGWDYDSAIVWSKAQLNDVTHNRVRKDLLRAGLEDSTPAAINIFDPGLAGIENAMTDVYRRDTSVLRMFDFKMSNPSVASLPAGDLGMLIGAEWRYESYNDDRDPNLDGTIPFVANSVTNSLFPAGLTHPYVGNIVGNSPTTDASGDKTTKSFFVEFAIPITDKINAQVATRYEDIENIGSTNVSKAVVGYEVTPSLFIRASWQEAFRAPNLVQVHQGEVARRGTRTDYVYEYLMDYAAANNISTAVDGDRWTFLRYASARTVEDGLLPEESTNSNIGIVFTPDFVPGLTITADAWSIEKENTIALLGRGNHSALDLVMRLENGLNNCDTYQGNTALITDFSQFDLDEVTGIFQAAGMCPRGQILIVQDEYFNMATRTIEGTDVALIYELDTSIGDFTLKINHTSTDKFEQEATGVAAALQTAENSGNLPSGINIEGFGDLLQVDGNFDEKYSAKLYYHNGNWRASLSAFTRGDIFDSAVTNSAGDMMPIAEMTTINTTLSYKFNDNVRVKIGINNIEDERAPLGRGFFGYKGDTHSDLGRSYYTQITARF